MPSKRIFDGGGVPSGPLPFSPAIGVGPWIFISGQASTDDAGQIVAGTFAEEFRRTMANVERVLSAAGVTLQDVVQVRSYVGRQEDLAEYNQLYREWFQAPHPVRTTLIGCLGTVLKFEMDVIAIQPS